MEKLYDLMHAVIAISGNLVPSEQHTIL